MDDGAERCPLGWLSSMIIRFLTSTGATTE
jgi:hypothetical protein